MRPSGTIALGILAAIVALLAAPAAAQGPIYGTIAGPNASFQNTGTTAAVNVTVRFYVDGVLAGTEKIARLNPGAQVTETLNYLPSGLQPGTHQVRVEADLDGNGVIDPAKGEAVVSSLFYRGTAPLSTAWTVVVGIAVFLPVLLLTVALRRRQRA